MILAWVFVAVLSIVGYGIGYDAIVNESDKLATILGSGITACVSALNSMMVFALLGWWI